MSIEHLRFESELWAEGYNFVAGIDEVGRGPLAGPVTACAAIFGRDFYLDEVQDSKKLTPAKREYLANILCEQAVSWSLGSASVEEIEKVNIRQATFIAMRRAIESLNTKPDFVLIDGENLPQAIYASKGVVKGDSLSFTIGAASIIAKVNRDTYMQTLDKEYPVYKFAKNKGYGTAEHIQALKEHGPSPYHRRSFLGKILYKESAY